MNKTVVIDLSDPEVCRWARMKIWRRSVLDRLVIMLEQLRKQIEIIHSPVDNPSDVLMLPGNLVCSAKFLKGWIESGQDFRTYSKCSPYVFSLCTSEAVIRKAQRELFKDSKKETNGWVAIKINAKISIPISRFLSRYSIHNNWITLMNLPVALLGPWLFLGNGYRCAALSGLVFQLGSILDGCDGEIARTKLQVTKFGGWLDTALDNFSYLAFFLAVGVWQSRVQANPFYFQALMAGLFSLLLALLTTYIGMHRLGTQTHHVYRQAFVALSNASRTLRTINHLNFLSRRENFSVGIMFLCLLDLRNAVYWALLCALFLYSAVVIGTFPKIYKKAKMKGAPHA